MANIYSMSDTWNDGATTFTAIKMDVTDTASASGSLLMDLQVGEVSKFSVAKSGATYVQPAGNRGAPDYSFVGDEDTGMYRSAANQLSFSVGTSADLHISNGRVHIAGLADLEFGANANALGVTNVKLAQEGNGVLAQRNGTNAQTFNLYGTYTDSSNLRRLVMTMSGAGVAEIKPDGLGTGSSGNVLHISGLPTSNPGPGILWNNAGTVEVGT